MFIATFRPIAPRPIIPILMPPLPLAHRPPHFKPRAQERISCGARRGGEGAAAGRQRGDRKSAQAKRRKSDAPTSGQAVQDRAGRVDRQLAAEFKVGHGPGGGRAEAGSRPRRGSGQAVAIASPPRRNGVNRLPRRRGNPQAAPARSTASSRPSLRSGMAPRRLAPTPLEGRLGNVQFRARTKKRINRLFLPSPLRRRR